MSNISVAEILKIYGKYIEGKQFAEFVAEKKRITERHAYNLIKAAAEKGEILKIPLPDRTVLYGLAEFGSLPSTEDKKPSEDKEAGTKELAKTLVYYRLLEKEYGSKTAGRIADILEGLKKRKA